MLSNLRLMFQAATFAACVLIATAHVEAGCLYALGQQSAAPNSIYGYAVNEATGSLSLLGNFPMATGGNGGGLSDGKIAIDLANQRLYVVNAGSNTISAYKIADACQLTPLPFSPIALPEGIWGKLAVHPSGSPLVVNDSDLTPVAASFIITPTTATPAAGSPFSLGTGGSKNSSAFSRDGNFFYAGGGSGNVFAGFSVNSSTGVLTPLPGSPFDSGAVSPSGYSMDSKGRLFLSSPNLLELRVFPTAHGIPTGVTGNPFGASLGRPVSSALHPTEKFLYVADSFGGRVGGFQITGEGAATTLTSVGQAVTSNATQTNAVVMNGSGSLLFATNNVSRNITTYLVNATTGQLSFDNVQPVDTLGTSGTINGLAYVPQIRTVTNTANSGTGSLRAAVEGLAAVHSGAVITFDPLFFSVPRTIALTSGQISIATNINIFGPGADLLTLRNTAPAGAFSRVLGVTGGVSVNIYGITVAGGNVIGSGGGVSTNSPANILLIRDCMLTGNSATSFGGGIVNSGLLTIVNSTISENSSASNIASGGGIDNSGSLFLTNSTVSGNSKTAGGTSGGGIWTSGTASIVNSTITNNSNPGLGASGVLTVGTTTVTTVRNSIIAGNKNNSSTADVSGTFAPTGGGFNLIGNVGTATGFTQASDQTGTGASPLDPRLVKVLANKGGTTPVHMPLPNSPAVDKGNNSNITTDQRGLGRPFDHPGLPNASDSSDIGAIERGAQESIFTAPFDFDGDGKTDIGIFRPVANAEWWINRSSNASTFAAQFGTGSTPIAPADYTGDGKADVAIWRPANGTWFILRSEDFSFFSFPFGQNGDVPVPADFDGDAKADAAVFRPQSGTWFIQRSTDMGATIEGFGTNGDRPAPSDYDGDGRVDIAIYRPSNGQWWLNRSTAGVIAVTFGVSTDKTTPGDYTGDGKADVAFWRPSSGEWFILRSEDFSFFSFPFGRDGDVPAPGDYDGDGKHDATVFRPAGATWFSQRSTAGTLTQQFGVNTDRPIPNAFVQ